LSYINAISYYGAKQSTHCGSSAEKDMLTVLFELCWSGTTDTEHNHSFESRILLHSKVEFKWYDSL